MGLLNKLETNGSNLSEKGEINKASEALMDNDRATEKHIVDNEASATPGE